MKKRGEQAIRRVLICFGVSFFSLSLVPLAFRTQGEAGKILGIVIGAVFWLFLIFGFLSISGANRTMIPVRRKLAAEGKRIRQRYPGVLSFSRKPEHLAIYGVILCGLILLLADAVHAVSFGDWMFPILSGTLFSTALHGVVDGRNYKTLQLLQERREDGHEKDA